MKKILLAVLLLIVGAVVASPFLIGSQIQSVLTKRSEQMNQPLSYAADSSSLFKALGFKLDSYDKGFMNASATSTVKLALNDTAGGEGQVYEIPMASEISHGPYLGDKGFGLAHVVTRPKLDGLDVPKWINDETFKIETAMGFDRKLKQTLTMAAVNHEFTESGEPVKIAFGGATLSGVSPADNPVEIDGRMELAKLRIDDQSGPFEVQPFVMDIETRGQPDMSAGSFSGNSNAINVKFGSGAGMDAEVSVGAMQLSGDYKRSELIDMLLGKSIMTLNDISVTNPAALPKPINVPKFQLTTGLEEAGDKALNFSMTQQAELGAELAELMRLPVAVQSALLTLNIKSLPVSAIEKFQEVQRKAMAAAAEGKEEPPISDQELAQVLQDVANGGGRLELLLDAKAESGGLLADIDTGFRPGLEMTGAELMAVMSEPGPNAFLKLLVGKGNASLDKAVTDKAGLTPMLQFMLADFVTLEGEAFKSKLQLSDGQLLVNGKPLPMFQ